MARRATHMRKRRGEQGIKQLPWRDVVNPYAPLDVVSADQLEIIHQATLDLLENTGMKILHDRTRRIFAEAGLDVDESTQRVRFDRALVEEKIALAPALVTLRARNPHHNLTIGGKHIVFSSIGGPAFCHDLDRGRRRGSYEDMCNYMRLVQSLNILHQEGGGPFETIDLPTESRYLDLYLAQFRLLDKNCQAYALGRERTSDCIDMHCIALGCDRDGLAADPAVLGIIVL